MQDESSLPGEANKHSTVFERSRHRANTQHRYLLGGCQESFSEGLIFNYYEGRVRVGQAEKRAKEVTSTLMIKNAKPGME